MTLGETFDDTKIAIDIPTEPDPLATPIFAHMAKKKDIHPGDITKVLSQSMAKGSAPPARKSVVQDGVTYYMLQTSTSNIGLQATVKSGLALSLTVVQMEELQVIIFESLTAQDNKLMFKALTPSNC
jgi:hypothetical protein